MGKKSFRNRALGLLTSIILLMTCGLFATVIYSPSLGAQAADLLRSVLGNEAVARLEMALFQAQDSFQQLKLTAGLEKPETPWQAEAPIIPPIPDSQISQAESPTLEVAVTAAGRQEAEVASPSSLAPTSCPPGNQANQQEDLLTFSWPPEPLKPMGSMPGEGAWSPYIQDGLGSIDAYRTYLQPDPTRPYAFVAIVAFNLLKTHLHYILGSKEPYSPDSPPRSGQIPSEDLAAGHLLATFNGGFKATHGQFGAMSGQILALPPREDLGTIAIYRDHKVVIGEWGSDIIPSAEILDWRQNGPMVIHDDKVNPEIYNNSPKDWGYTVDDVSPTWRSGVGTGAGGHILYYFAGPKLTMEALANSMRETGADEALQLDINNYWVHFAAVRASKEKLVPEPLVPEAMCENIDRYLHPYTRDFFYLTDNSEP